ncbi:ergothioneine biosynthesis protein EgtB [Chryseotalea sanaruensis]|uniref:Ergothioneine biosynthesis protein EgtB n=1 Tax=Chryseotalea sanaruensis TaxID=2482724 RepID=A0A401U618_9BACT|nr:ergothioneine biosynthesis protein EgtB [Chryseotalea sanaruensis]GCC50290.1 ergothioneine biosynthesis protein EgtB [Chryseotalea sanaruensis]
MIVQYQTVRKHSVELCKPLQREDYVVQPSLDVSPPKWHLAHTTWFYEEMLLAKYLQDYQRFHPRYAFLFNSYYNTLGDRVLRPQRGNMSRPTVDGILAYREYVDEYMLKLIPQADTDVLSLIETALHHEQQHQELLLTDIKFILGHNPLFPEYHTDFKETHVIEKTHDFKELESGMYNIGHAGSGFAFDNEGKQHQVFLNAFKIRQSLVTNREYLAFVESGAYADPTHWHSDAWYWLQETKINSPLYWHNMNGAWHRYSLSGLQLLPLDEPVTHISFYEAAAFAEWSGMRLPTEFEWEAAAEHFQWGQRWEHTNSAYLAYPGYAKPPGALGEYNGKFMINQMVLRGASIATPQNHARKTYRNFFHPSMQWQFTGIRLCKK